MSTTTDQETYLLAECPVCDYALHGLPVEHTCPECGLEFDRRWWVYGGPDDSREWLTTGRVVQSVVPIAGAILAGVVLIKSPPMREIWIAFLALSLVLLGSAVLSANRRSRRFIALGPAALVVYHGPKHIERYPWSTISQPRADMRRKCVAFESAGRTIRVKGYDFFAGYFIDIERCARAINMYTRELEPYPFQ